MKRKFQQWLLNINPIPTNRTSISHHRGACLLYEIVRGEAVVSKYIHLFGFERTWWIWYLRFYSSLSIKSLRFIYAQHENYANAYIVQLIVTYSYITLHYTNTLRQADISFAPYHVRKCP